MSGGSDAGINPERPFMRDQMVNRSMSSPPPRAPAARGVATSGRAAGRGTGGGQNDSSTGTSLPARDVRARVPTKVSTRCLTGKRGEPHNDSAFATMRFLTVILGAAYPTNKARPGSGQGGLCAKSAALQRQPPLVV
jgi:hypothetical protein